MMIERRRVIVEGRVQGVGFRAFVRSKAQALGVNGYVQNLPDGRVEVVAEGRGADLEKLIAWVKKGPRHARVTGVRIDEEPASGGFERFSVRRA